MVERGACVERAWCVQNVKSSHTMLHTSVWAHAQKKHEKSSFYLLRDFVQFAISSSSPFLFLFPLIKHFQSQNSRLKTQQKCLPSFFLEKKKNKFYFLFLLLFLVSRYFACCFFSLLFLLCFRSRGYVVLKPIWIKILNLSCNYSWLGPPPW